MQPYLIYCNLFWGGSAKCYVDKLYILQKRAIRIISNASYLEHTKPLFINENLMDVHKMYDFSCSLYVFQHRQKNRHSDNLYNTRNSNSLLVKFQRLFLCKKSVYYNASMIFNALPIEISSLKSLRKFKINLKKHLIQRENVVS